MERTETDGVRWPSIDCGVRWPSIGPMIPGWSPLTKHWPDNPWDLTSSRSRDEPLILSSTQIPSSHLIESYSIGPFFLFFFYKMFCDNIPCKIPMHEDRMILKMFWCFVLFLHWHSISCHPFIQQFNLTIFLQSSSRYWSLNVELTATNGSQLDWPNLERMSINIKLWLSSPS